MFSILKILCKPKDIRTSSIEKDSFIRTVEMFLEKHPDIAYDDRVKDQLISWFEKREDSKIDDYLGWR